MFELMVFQVLFNKVLQYSERWGQKNNTLVSGNAGDKKNLHPGGHKFGFLSRFSGDIIFSSLVYFAFLILVFLLLFVWCFLNLKMYILMHILLCGRVSDSFHLADFRKQDYFFFGLNDCSVGFHKVAIAICINAGLRDSTPIRNK